MIKPTIELLAGIPTIVLGYFALTYVTPVILRDVLGLDVQIFNGLAAGIVLGILVLPTIASVTEDALSAVPQSLREGAYGLGATKRQVVVRVVFPAALSGIVAALVLGASRAIGETVIILVAGGANPSLSFDPAGPHQNMAAFIAQTARGDISAGSVEFLTIYAVGATLFLITLDPQRDRDQLRPALPAGVRLMAAASTTPTPGVIDPASAAMRLKERLFHVVAPAVHAGRPAVPRRAHRRRAAGRPVATSAGTSSRRSPRACSRRTRASARRCSGRSTSSSAWRSSSCRSGVASAVYLEEYADRNRWWNRVIELNIQNLAAVPSVVYGILGLAWIVRGPLSLGRILLAGALCLSLLVLPVVIVVSREAIRAVPPSIREGSLALGRDAVADDLEAGAAGRAPGNRHGSDPRSVPRHRRDRAAHPRRSRSHSSASIRR